MGTDATAHTAPRRRLAASLTVVVVSVTGSLAVARPPAAVAVTAPGQNPASVLARLTEAQRVGQLVMVAASLSGVSAATRSAVSTYHVGSVILTGRSSAGVAAVRSMTSGLQSLATSAATGGVPLFVSADQEGGYVQTLSGPGFFPIPTALAQGLRSPATLRSDATVWGGQLAAAGVNLDLAPVLDTVPPTMTTTNRPIGVYQREFATNPTAVTRAGSAFIQGMHVAGVETAVKHFPGLGRVTGNTDTTFGVTDTVTTRHDAYLAPFAAGTSTAGAEMVMVSLATYARIDPAHRAVFSPTVIGGMLRGDLGFTGVVISDSMDATAVRDLTPGQRAVQFVQAGGDLVLITQPADAAATVSALLAKAGADPAFRARVDASCLRVLIAKQRAGLLAGTVATAATGGRLFAAEHTGPTGLAMYTRSGGVWSGPVPLAGSTAGRAALSPLPGGGGVEVAEVTPSGAAALLAYRPGQPPAGWSGLAATATSPPALATFRDGRMDLAVRGADRALWLREYQPGAGWGAWSSLGGGVGNAAPAAVYTPSGDLDVFVLGEPQAIYRNVRHAGRWSGWQNLGGAGLSAPAAAVDPLTAAVTVFVEGRNHTLWQQTVGVTGWTQVPGVRTVSAPAVSTPVAGNITVVVEGLDGALYLASRTGAGWTGWSRLPFA